MTTIYLILGACAGLSLLSSLGMYISARDWKQGKPRGKMHTITFGALLALAVLVAGIAFQGLMLQREYHNMTSGVRR